jgi:hypothetical protein
LLTLADRASPDLTRRQLLRGAGAVAALAAAAAGGVELLRGRERIRRIHSFAAKPSGSARSFHSRPDLQPPTVTASAAEGTEALGGEDPPRFLFLGPGPVSLKGSQQYGPLIVDLDGEPVWFRPVASGLEVTNFASSWYRGEPVLIWWEGKVLTSGYGHGEAVIVDRAYRELTRVRAANGRSMDMHALWLTRERTAIFTCYPRVVHVDLSSIGGPRHGQALESIIQEVDVASGRLLFEWASLPHVSVSDSYQRLATPYDYLHVNSVSPTRDGNLLVSGRHTWALYKLERRTGEVMWTLGGKRSDFWMGRGAQFTWQHDAQQVTDRILTVFDNGTDGPIQTERQSRGLVLGVDESRRTVGVRNAYTNHKPLLATAMGSVQILPSGHVVVGWGTASHTTEFAADGTLLLDADLPARMYSYRGLSLAWRSTPHHLPAVTASRHRQSGIKLVYASWNGATEVTDWRVDAGSAADQLQPVGIAKRHGFETVIPLHPELRFASLTALDRSGRPLRRSETFRL